MLGIEIANAVHSLILVGHHKLATYRLSMKLI